MIPYPFLVVDLTRSTTVVEPHASGVGYSAEHNLVTHERRIMTKCKAKSVRLALVVGVGHHELEA